ncbi:glycine receptor subunit alpha-2-like [Octopus sinensis]|uniref:Gamma-aminobutyric acid receptor subunit beta n=1 Tax=Octopus sinensis TaxID=2607531 RepID=A0A6P7T2M6_9MOLL|nr:glycine receptor subunit alpha-2-like [Octopus sinensis]
MKGEREKKERLDFRKHGLTFKFTIVWAVLVWLPLVARSARITANSTRTHNDSSALKTKRSVSNSDFLQTLIEAYDSSIPPGFDREKVTTVNVQLYINSFDSINEQTMDYSISTFITQEWTDERLKFFGLIEAKYFELDVKLIEKIWVPDLYFPNEKKAHFHEVTVPNRMLHIYDDGSITYRARISLTASCPMKLQNYPMDTQVCQLYLQSFTYSVKTVKFQWHENPVVMSPSIVLPQFRLVKNLTDDCTSHNKDKNFTCLYASFYLKRDIGYYMIQLYIPSILIVFLSWVSFYLNVSAVPARISLGILTVLTLTTQRSAGIAALPKVSYIKAIDVWMASCLCFVFAALLEFAFVNVLDRRYLKIIASMKENELTGKCPEVNDRVKSKRFKWIRDPRGQQKAAYIDFLARITFPIAFGIFCIIYWLVYGVVGVKEE